MCYDRQAGVGDAVLMDIKHKLRVLDDVHPEPERKAADQRTHVSDMKTETLFKLPATMSQCLTSCSSTCAGRLDR